MNIMNLLLIVLLFADVKDGGGDFFLNRPLMCWVLSRNAPTLAYFGLLQGSDLIDLFFKITSEKHFTLMLRAFQNKCGKANFLTCAF